MNYEAATALGVRLVELRKLLDQEESGHYVADKHDDWVDEEEAIEEMLVGDDPLIRDAIRWLNERHPVSEVADMDKPVRAGGNEHWVFYDVAVGDDYKAVDLWEKYAIWRNTGAVYRLVWGAVEDDPIFTPIRVSPPPGQEALP